jgi:hypothetical protein
MSNKKRYKKPKILQGSGGKLGLGKSKGLRSIFGQTW